MAQVVIAGLLPTLIHVYCFTALFLAYGARKSRTVAGWAPLAVHLTLPVVLLRYAMPGASYIPGFGSFMVGVVGVQCMAYAYTYHYLNWFAKTRVIGWADVSRRRLALILVLWAASVALYYVNYQLGLTVLFGLSLAHVFLELPLDIRTISFLTRA
jgi:hypothetical protein